MSSEDLARTTRQYIRAFYKLLVGFFVGFSPGLLALVGVERGIRFARTQGKHTDAETSRDDTVLSHFLSYILYRSIARTRRKRTSKDKTRHS